jgi:outer membrane protein TolC
MVGACGPEYYKADADEEVYDIIDRKWKDRFGEQANYAISDVPASPNDIQVDRAVPESAVLSLAEAVAIATAHNRSYQRQKEQLYLTALDLTLARHQFARRWFGTIDAAYVTDNKEEQVSYNVSPGFTQLLADGASISANIALDWSRFLTDDPRTSLRSLLSAQVVQPLLRGSGRLVVQENLTQAERNALYQIRTFNRFRKNFVISVVDSYYRVLQQKDQVTNAENNYNSRIESRKRLEMEAEAGRKPHFEVDQARQAELTARDALVRVQQSYEQQLDEFKIFLSLPTDAEVSLDPNELEVLREAGVTEPDYALAEAVNTALARRLDLANSRDAVDDATRKVAVAADGLGADLDLIGSADVSSTGRNDYRRLQFHRGRYSLGLQADLPLDRKAERNAYREALITLTQQEREYENFVDQVKLEVRQAYRRLREEAESYRTQELSLELARKRVESTTILLKAGRATTRDLLESQDALLAAQNSVTAALIGHAIAKLGFFADIGLLHVRPDGMWEEKKAQYAAGSDTTSAERQKIPENATAKYQVDFRDFLAESPRIWEQ